ncbi:hypothetical protein HK405_015155, partial [Cladochytrium tenue]
LEYWEASVNHHQAQLGHRLARLLGTPRPGHSVRQPRLSGPTVGWVLAGARHGRDGATGVLGADGTEDRGKGTVTGIGVAHRSENAARGVKATHCTVPDRRVCEKVLCGAPSRDLQEKSACREHDSIPEGSSAAAPHVAPEAAAQGGAEVLQDDPEGYGGYLIRAPIPRVVKGHAAAAGKGNLPRRPPRRNLRADMQASDQESKRV